MMYSKQFFATLDEAKKVLFRMKKILQDKNIVYSFGHVYPNELVNKFTMVRRQFSDEVIYLCIVKRAEVEEISGMPQEEYYISSVNYSDMDLGRIYLIPLLINPTNKVEECLVSPRENLFPVIITKDEQLIIDLIEQFNNDPNQKYKWNSYPFRIEFAFHLGSNEVYYDRQTAESKESKINPSYRFFSTKGQEYAFALLKTDTQLRQTLLGITPFLYHSEATAKVWYTEILNTLVNDNELPHGLKRSAIKSLDYLYDSMIKNTTKDKKYFATEGQRIAFYCIHTDGKTRNAALGLTDELYDPENKKNAEAWYSFTRDTIAKDKKVDSEDKIKTLYVLSELFDVITDDGSFGDDND